jgi:hypothetical protein
LCLSADVSNAGTTIIEDGCVKYLSAGKVYNLKVQIGDGEDIWPKYSWANVLNKYAIVFGIGLRQLSSTWAYSECWWIRVQAEQICRADSESLQKDHGADGAGQGVRRVYRTSGKDSKGTRILFG